MKRLFAGSLLVVILLAYASVAWAECVTTTTFVGSKMIICTTCCFNGVCTQTCT